MTATSNRENRAEADCKEVDLWTGQVRDRATGRVVACLSPWKRRERVIGTEMFLATQCGPGALGLLEMATVWRGWLDSAISLQHIRNMFNAPRCGMNNALRPYGWHVGETGFARWVVTRDENGSGGHATISAAGAVGPFRAAYDAIARADYAPAMVTAVEALTQCGESRYARLLIGTCHFVHEVDVDGEIALDTAKYLLDLKADLQRTAGALSRLWRQELRRRPERWAFVPDYIRQCEEELAAYGEMFERARRFLCGE